MEITSKDQLIDNLDRVEGYLTGASESDYRAMANFISHGRVFVTYIVNGQYHFAPSRFVGYAGNTLVEHKDDRGHGWDTNDAISTVLCSKNRFDPTLEDAYLKYCDILGERRYGYHRSYWLLDEDLGDQLNSEIFREGVYQLRTHLVRERNRKVVQIAKQQFKDSHCGKLFCEICGFDFYEKYGKLGEGFIEAHHKVELSKTDGEYEIKPSDFLMVCSNCHSMLHVGSGVSDLELKKCLR